MENEINLNVEMVNVTDQGLTSVENEPEREKRPVKLTAKALVEKLDTLQKLRKAKLNKAQKLKESINKQMCDDNEYKPEIRLVFEDFKRLCSEAKDTHESLLVILPVEECEKHDIWFKAKMISNNEFLERTNKWLSDKPDGHKISEVENLESDVGPGDSVSNVSHATSKRSKCSARSSSSSSISSACIQAEAEKAALMARAAALKAKHGIEVQEEELRRKKEQLDLDAQIAASTARISVLQKFDQQSKCSSSSSSKKIEKVVVTANYSSQTTYLNPNANDYVPVNSMPLDLDGYTGVSASQAAIQDQRIGWIDQQTSEHANGNCSAQTQHDSIIQHATNILPAQGDPLLEILKKQEELTAHLVQQQAKPRILPKKEIPTFDGDPLQYIPFIRAFEHGIEQKTTNLKDQLYFLEQFTKGQPKDLVRSCQYMSSEKGYAMAKKLLKEHFGNEFKVSTAYMEKALGWPTLKAEDVQGLQAYALFLRTCCNTMDELSYMQELNMPSNMKSVVMKLPYKLREQWRAKACQIMESVHGRPKFCDIVEFIEKQVKMASDPVFGDIQDKHGASKLKVQPHKPFTRSSFATDISTSIPAKKFSDALAQPKSCHVSKSNGDCLFCKNQHLLERCFALKKRTQHDKIEFLKAKGICFGCLKTGHKSKRCENRLKCDICGETHPTILHIYGKEVILKKAEEKRKDTSVQTCGHTGAGTERTLMSIIPVQVKAIKSNKVVQTYAFLDPGSSATFCSEHLQEELNLNGKKINILLRTMGQEKSVSCCVIDGLEISGLNTNNFFPLPAVYTQQKMPVSSQNIITQEELSKWSYLDKVKIPCIQAEVDLLIGINAANVMEPHKIINSQGNGPFAIKTLLGWVVNGTVEGNSEHRNEVGHSDVTVNRISVVRLEELLNNQFNHDFNEKTVDEKEMSREDLQFMSIMNNSVKHQDGHYSLRLPFKSDVTLPNNLGVAKQRLLGLKRKLEINQEFHEKYTYFLEGVIHKGYAEKVPDSQLDRLDGKVWYIPHHGVFHPKKGSLRVVFDCGAAYKGTSLNDNLLQGPNLTSSLVGVLLKFRQEPVAFMADIEAMFHQVRVAAEDVDFLRFLWWPGGELNKEPITYRMTVHLFGAVSSPSCASFALKQTAKDNEGDFPLEVIETINNNFYVDDCLKSVSCEEKAISMAKDLTCLCQKGGFRLTKWISNSREVLQSISQENRAKDIQQLDLDRDKLPVERALGLQWSVDADTFQFKISLKTQPCTRRGILSVVSSVYDPLGFLAPVILPAKVILQELCRKTLGWDDTIPSAFQKQWTHWIVELDKVAEFQVNRCFKPVDYGLPSHACLHHFADACETGYGTVSYLKMLNGADKVHVSFLMGKSRVTPLKHVTIPRLELTAAVLAVKMDILLKKMLQLPLEDSVFWSDSTTVLNYIKNENKRFHTFVANRVSFIRDATQPQQWRYVPTKDNPADDASRGLNVESFLNNERWLKGPSFLWKPSDVQFHTSDSTSMDDDDPEVKRELKVNAVTLQSEQNATCKLIHYFSDWKRLKVAVAWILKLQKLLLQLSRKRKELSLEHSDDATMNAKLQHFKSSLERQSLTVEDVYKAEVNIIRFSQQEQFQEEIAALKHGNTVKRNSSVYKLDPMLHDGVLLVGGRLGKSAMPSERKHPILLSKNQHVSHLILSDIHKQLGHGGRNQMLSKLRCKYWITNANSVSRKIISKCVICRRFKGKLGEQRMADLPVERITPDLPPFTNVGVDFFGPIEVKRGRGTVKRYGVLFTCMASRAVHLEMAYSLDTDSCINALRRFICRRGQVSSMRSDNGTNFISAERELKEALSALNKEKIQRALLQKGVDWSFNPPSSPHFGGVWERLIRLVKQSLCVVLRQQTLDDEALQTVLCEAEAILNDRPISNISNDPNDLEALTPNHLLLLKGNPALPPGLFERSDSYAKRRWRQVQYISDLFWKRWVREYLPLLQKRQKWNKEHRNLTVGDIVIIADSTAPRGSWVLGRVIETFPDSRGLVRSVKVQTKCNILERSISKLCLLQEST